MNRRQREFADHRKQQDEHDARIEAYVWARVLRGHNHERATKELIPLGKAA